MSSPAHRTHTMRAAVDVDIADMLSCGICGCLLPETAGDFHRRWHEQPDRETGYGDGFGANQFSVHINENGVWEANCPSGAVSLGNSPGGALRNLIETLTGRRDD